MQTDPATLAYCGSFPQVALARGRFLGRGHPASIAVSEAGSTAEARTHWYVAANGPLPSDPIQFESVELTRLRSTWPLARPARHRADSNAPHSASRRAPGDNLGIDTSVTGPV